MNKEKTIYQRAFEALEAYENIVNSKEMTKIDNNLIQFLDPNIKLLMEM